MKFTTFGTLLIGLHLFLPVYAQQFSDETIAIEAMTMDTPYGMPSRILSGVMATPIHPAIVLGDYSMGAPNMMMNKLFTPAMIMRNQSKLNLSSKQTDTIKKEMRIFQSNIVDVQWDLNSASASLNENLSENSIDVNATLKVVDSVLTAENKLKKMHLTLLIKIYNILDKKQIETLRKSVHPHFMSMTSSPVNEFLLNEKIHEER